MNAVILQPVTLYYLISVFCVGFAPLIYIGFQDSPLSVLGVIVFVSISGFCFYRARNPLPILSVSNNKVVFHEVGRNSDEDLILDANEILEVQFLPSSVQNGGPAGGRTLTHRVVVLKKDGEEIFVAEWGYSQNVINNTRAAIAAAIK